MILVADSSALIPLAAGGALEHLATLFERVVVPPAVREECSIAGKAAAGRLQIFLADLTASAGPAPLPVVAGLGRGELEAIGLALHLAARSSVLLLIDDGRARAAARRLGIAVIGSLGVLLAAKRRGLIPAVGPALETLRAAGGYYSDSLIRQALELAGETGQ